MLVVSGAIWHILGLGIIILLYIYGSRIVIVVHGIHRLVTMSCILTLLQISGSSVRSCLKARLFFWGGVLFLFFEGGNVVQFGVKEFEFEDF